MAEIDYVKKFSIPLFLSVQRNVELFIMQIFSRKTVFDWVVKIENKKEKIENLATLHPYISKTYQELFMHVVFNAIL